MKKFANWSILAVAAVALLVAAQVEAQTTMPICSYARTYSFSGHTRGFFGQSPADICVTQLNVPNEMGEPVQNAQIFIMPGAPPAFPATGTQTSVFWAGNQPSSAPIDTGGIDIASGEWFGFLGACGCTTMRNSYCSSGAFTSMISGTPVVINRYGTQNNTCNAPAPNYWGIVNSTISRVEVTYTDGACGGGPGPGGGCSPAQCANLDCSVCSRADQASVDALETKADQLQTDVTGIANDIGDLQDAVDALEVKLDEIEVGDIPCETLRLVLPFLPGHPELPSTHQCFTGTTTLTPAGSGGRLEMGGRSGQTVDPG